MEAHKGITYSVCITVNAKTAWEALRNFFDYIAPASEIATEAQAQVFDRIVAHEMRTRYNNVRALSAIALHEMAWELAE